MGSSVRTRCAKERRCNTACTASRACACASWKLSTSLVAMLWPLAGRDTRAGVKSRRLRRRAGMVDDMESFNFQPAGALASAEQAARECRFGATLQTPELDGVQE